MVVLGNRRSLQGTDGRRGEQTIAARINPLAPVAARTTATAPIEWPTRTMPWRASPRRRSSSLAARTSARSRPPRVVYEPSLPVAAEIDDQHAVSPLAKEQCAVQVALDRVAEAVHDELHVDRDCRHDERLFPALHPGLVRRPHGDSPSRGAGHATPLPHRVVDPPPSRRPGTTRPPRATSPRCAGASVLPQDEGHCLHVDGGESIVG
jgi:hypothetical protein